LLPDTDLFQLLLPQLEAGTVPAFFVFVLPAKTGYERCLSEMEPIKGM
jgi:hypothetical protein